LDAREEAVVRVATLEAEPVVEATSSLGVALPSLLVVGEAVVLVAESGIEDDVVMYSMYQS